MSIWNFELLLMLTKSLSFLALSLYFTSNAIAFSSKSIASSILPLSDLEQAMLYNAAESFGSIFSILSKHDIASSYLPRSYSA